MLVRLKGSISSLVVRDKLPHYRDALKSRLLLWRLSFANGPLRHGALGRPLEPPLFAAIEFRCWTGDSRLRHVSFKGLREHADQADIFEILPDQVT